MKNFLKRYVDYLWSLGCVGVAAYSFSVGDAVGGWVALAIGVALVAWVKVINALPGRGADTYGREERDRKLAEFEAAYLARRGLEPVPIPGEDVKPHKLGEDPTCCICRNLREGP